MFKVLLNQFISGLLILYMVLKDMKQIKEKLKSVENIKFSKHAEDKLEKRRIEKDLIVKNLRNPQKLTKFSYEPDKE